MAKTGQKSPFSKVAKRIFSTLFIVTYIKKVKKFAEIYCSFVKMIYFCFIKQRDKINNKKRKKEAKKMTNKERVNNSDFAANIVKETEKALLVSFKIEVYGESFKVNKVWLPKSQMQINLQTAEAVWFNAPAWLMQKKCKEYFANIIALGYRVKDEAKTFASAINSAVVDWCWLAEAVEIPADEEIKEQTIEQTKNEEKEMKKNNKVNENGLVFRLRKETKTAELTHCPTDKESVVIPSEVQGCKVTLIARGAFKDCDKIKTVVIPDTVTEIANYAFSCCKELSDVVVPEGAEIHYDSFFLCKQLPFSYNY